MLSTIVFSGVTAYFFYAAKKTREETGAVKNYKSALTVLFGIASVISAVMWVLN